MLIFNTLVVHLWLPLSCQWETGFGQECKQQGMSTCISLMRCKAVSLSKECAPVFVSQKRTQTEWKAVSLSQRYVQVCICPYSHKRISQITAQRTSSEHYREVSVFLRDRRRRPLPPAVPWRWSLQGCSEIWKLLIMMTNTLPIGGQESLGLTSLFSLLLYKLNKIVQNKQTN